MTIIADRLRADADYKGSENKKEIFHRERHRLLTIGNLSGSSSENNGCVATPQIVAMVGSFRPAAPSQFDKISSIRANSRFTFAWLSFTRSLNFEKSISVPSSPFA